MRTFALIFLSVAGGGTKRNQINKLNKFEIKHVQICVTKN